MNAPRPQQGQNRLVFFLVGLAFGAVLGAVFLVPILSTLLIALVLVLLIGAWFEIEFLSEIAAKILISIWDLCAWLSAQVTRNIRTEPPTKGEKGSYALGIAVGIVLVPGLFFFRRGTA